MLQFGMRYYRVMMVIAVVILAGCLSGCSAAFSGNQTPTRSPATKTANPTNTPLLSPTATIAPGPTPLPTPTPQPFRIAAVGDIAICGQEGHPLTAALLPQDLDAILILGDANNEDGLLWQYETCFAPAWGKFLDRIYPAPGNHDYYSDPLQGYYAYFGERAGPAGRGYYAVDLGGWQIISLNTNCGFVPCGPSSEQALWLADLLAQPQPQCTLAFWHHPRWSSGLAGETYWIATLWDYLDEAGADLVLSGHDHHYERIAALNREGEIDERAGMRSFIVGTGGASTRGLAEVKPYSEQRIVGEFGVLFLDLYETDYEWRFVNVAGQVLDEGRAECR